MKIRGLLNWMMLTFAATIPAQAYEAGTVTGGGKIEGTIVYRGEVEMKQIIPTKDTATCGGPREDPLIQVGSDGAVQNAVVYLAEVAKGKAWPPPGKMPELDNVKCRFTSRTRARSGQHRDRRQPPRRSPPGRA